MRHRSSSPFPLWCCALIWSAACGPTGSVNLQVLSISDWHGQIDPLSTTDSSGNLLTVGGAGLLSAYFIQDRAANPDTLTFSAGDSIGASPALSSFFQDKPSIAALNVMQLDGDTFGNHDFDYGLDVLEQRVSEASFAYISTNLANVKAQFNPPVAVPYRMYVVGHDPVKVAVLGITNPDAPTLTLPGNMGALQVTDPVSAANAAAKQARSDGAAVVIALAHMGAVNRDASGNPVGPAIDLAQKLEGVDVLLADHTDLQVNTPINGVLVVENHSKGLTYARLDIRVVDGKVISKSATIVDPVGTIVHPLPAGQSCPATACPDSTWSCVAGQCQQTVQTPDPAVETQVGAYRVQLRQQLDQRIGSIDSVFVRDGSTERKQEVPVGDLVADALLDKYAVQGAQLVFTNGGGLRSTLPSSYAPANPSLVRTNCSTSATCDLVAGDVYTLLPFGNTCVVRQISGALLWQALEHSVAQFPNPFGGFLQIAGFSFEYSASAAPGARVVKVTLAGGHDIPRNDATLYTLVTNNFTNSGGDGYSMLVETNPSANRDVMAQVVLDYIKAKGAISLANYPQNRIIQDP